MKLTILTILSLTFLFTACSKSEGTGGTGTITGKLMKDTYLYINGVQSQVVQDQPAATEDVYIVYGDGTVADDKVEVSYDGSFEFKYLQPGDYTVFAYSEVFNPGNNLNNNDDDYYTFEVVKVPVKVTKKTSTDAGTLEIRR